MSFSSFLCEFSLNARFYPSGFWSSGTLSEGKQWLPCLPSLLTATHEQMPTDGIDTLMLRENQLG